MAEHVTNGPISGNNGEVKTQQPSPNTNSNLNVNYPPSFRPLGPQHPPTGGPPQRPPQNGANNNTGFGVNPTNPRAPPPRLQRLDSRGSLPLQQRGPPGPGTPQQQGQFIQRANPQTGLPVRPPPPNLIQQPQGPRPTGPAQPTGHQTQAPRPTGNVQLRPPNQPSPTVAFRRVVNAVTARALSPTPEGIAVTNSTQPPIFARPPHPDSRPPAAFPHRSLSSGPLSLPPDLQNPIVTGAPVLRKQKSFGNHSIIEHSLTAARNIILDNSKEEKKVLEGGDSTDTIMPLGTDTLDSGLKLGSAKNRSYSISVPGMPDPGRPLTEEERRRSVSVIGSQLPGTDVKAPSSLAFIQEKMTLSEEKMPSLSELNKTATPPTVPRSGKNTPERSGSRTSIRESPVTSRPASAMKNYPTENKTDKDDDDDDVIMKHPAKNADVKTASPIPKSKPENNNSGTASPALSVKSGDGIDMKAPSPVSKIAPAEKEMSASPAASIKSLNSIGSKKGSQEDIIGANKISRTPSPRPPSTGQTLIDRNGENKKGLQKGPSYTDMRPESVMGKSEAKTPDSVASSMNGSKDLLSPCSDGDMSSSALSKAKTPTSDSERKSSASSRPVSRDDIKSEDEGVADTSKSAKSSAGTKRPSSSKSKEGDNDSGVDESTQGNECANGDASSPNKASKIPGRRQNASSPTKTTPPKQRPPRSPKTPDIAPPSAPTPPIRKVPMNKIQVGTAPSPNLKVIRSKIGSLDNTTYRPGGGNIKIENKKIDLTNVQPKIAAKNEKYTPKGGDKKITQVKLKWEAKPKIGSLDNASHRPGGGDKKIETVKLDFKDKAKSKVASKDNIKHTPSGGDIKSPKEQTRGEIEQKKLEFKATSKIGSLDNMKHRPGGGDKKIFDDKEYLRQMSATHGDLSPAASGTQKTNSKQYLQSSSITLHIISPSPKRNNIRQISVIHESFEEDEATSPRKEVDVKKSTSYSTFTCDKNGFGTGERDFKSLPLISHSNLLKDTKIYEKTVNGTKEKIEYISLGNTPDLISNRSNSQQAHIRREKMSSAKNQDVLKKKWQIENRSDYIKKE